MCVSLGRERRELRLFVSFLSLLRGSCLPPISSRRCWFLFPRPGIVRSDPFMRGQASGCSVPHTLPQPATPRPVDSTPPGPPSRVGSDHQSPQLLQWIYNVRGRGKKLKKTHTQDNFFFLGHWVYSFRPAFRRNE